jgi:predicted transcriptional regulator
MYTRPDTIQVHFILSVNLLDALDELAKYHLMNRSELIRLALREFADKPVSQARLGTKSHEPGRDVELEQMLKDFQKLHPDVGELL